VNQIIMAVVEAAVAAVVAVGTTTMMTTTMETYWEKATLVPASKCQQVTERRLAEAKFLEKVMSLVKAISLELVCFFPGYS
jgi:hypothetical protein